MIPLIKIDKAKNIVVLTDSSSFANASAFYTYILTLHKKVSLVSIDSELEQNLSCIPWFDSVKKNISSSSDLIIDIREENELLFFCFKKHNIKINKKMATSIYVSILKATDSFINESVDSKVFLALSELISLGADYKICNNFILKSLPLSLFRLKSIMYRDMFLRYNAKLAVLYINKESLEKSGATLEDAHTIMKETLTIAHVDSVILLDTDLDNKQIKIIKRKE